MPRIVLSNADHPVSRCLMFLIGFPALVLFLGASVFLIYRGIWHGPLWFCIPAVAVAAFAVFVTSGMLRGALVSQECIFEEAGMLVQMRLLGFVYKKRHVTKQQLSSVHIKYAGTGFPGGSFHKIAVGFTDGGKECAVDIRQRMTVEQPEMESLQKEAREIACVLGVPCLDCACELCADGEDAGGGGLEKGQ